MHAVKRVYHIIESGSLKEISQGPVHKVYGESISAEIGQYQHTSVEHVADKAQGHTHSDTVPYHIDEPFPLHAVGRIRSVV